MKKKIAFLFLGLTSFGLAADFEIIDPIITTENPTMGMLCCKEEDGLHHLRKVSVKIKHTSGYIVLPDGTQEDVDKEEREITLSPGTFTSHECGDWCFRVGYNPVLPNAGVLTAKQAKKVLKREVL